MVEDFIQANKLQARIMPYAAKGRLIKCVLFSCGKFEAIVISFVRDKVSPEKLKAALNVPFVKPVPSSSVEEITGYDAEFLPPISVYGVKVLLDRKVLAFEKLRCIVGEEKTLEITPAEIIEANEDVAEADITL